MGIILYVVSFLCFVWAFLCLLFGATGGARQAEAATRHITWSVVLMVAFWVLGFLGTL